MVIDFEKNAEAHLEGFKGGLGKVLEHHWCEAVKLLADI